MMLKRLQRTFGAGEGTRPTPEAGYQPITTLDGGAETDGLAPVHEDSGRAYWAFWALGAGVLLAWNGMSASCAQLHTTERREKRGERKANAKS
jgi:hypothetical protein